MADGVDPTGPMDETSLQETTNGKEATSNRLAWIVLTALVVSMTGLAPDGVVALLRVIGV